MTSALLSRDEIVRGLLARGAEPEMAARAADRILAVPGNQPTVVRLLGEPVARVEGMRVELLPPDPPAAMLIPWPLRLTLPWSFLESDNRSRLAKLFHVGPNRTPIAKLVMQDSFRAAKAKVRTLARETLGAAEPTKRPLALTARVWVPDTGRHDIPNFAKGVHDALTDVVYVDDSQLHDVRWIRAGVDVDHPRAELTITPL